MKLTYQQREILDNQLSFAFIEPEEEIAQLCAKLAEWKRTLMDFCSNTPVDAEFLLSTQRLRTDVRESVYEFRSNNWLQGLPMHKEELFHLIEDSADNLEERYDNLHYHRKRLNSRSDLEIVDRMNEAQQKLEDFIRFVQRYEPATPPVSAPAPPVKPRKPGRKTDEKTTEAMRICYECRRIHGMNVQQIKTELANRLGMVVKPSTIDTYVKRWPARKQRLEGTN